jgi:hypothetical protein
MVERSLCLIGVGCDRCDGFEFLGTAAVIVVVPGVGSSRRRRR